LPIAPPHGVSPRHFPFCTSLFSQLDWATFLFRPPAPCQSYALHLKGCFVFRCDRPLRIDCFCNTSLSRTLPECDGPPSRVSAANSFCGSMRLWIFLLLLGSPLFTREITSFVPLFFLFKVFAPRLSLTLFNKCGFDDFSGLPPPIVELYPISYVRTIHWIASYLTPGPILCTI